MEVELSKIQYAFLVLVALVCGLLGGTLSTRFLQAPTEEDKGHKNIIIAQEFHLVDQEGKERWVLNLSKDGEPSLTFVNKNGWAPMAMGINQEGLPYFNMVLEPGRKGGPSLILMDSRMERRALLGVRGDGEPHLSLLDQNGIERVSIGSTEFPNPLTGINERRPCSSITLFDEDGKPVWSAPEVRPMPITLSSAKMKQAP